MKKASLLVIVAALLASGLAILVRSNVTTAADTMQAKVDITPVEVNLSLAPGEIYNGKFSVINRGKEDVNFHVAKSGFYVKDLTYQTTFDQDTIFNQIKHWITFDKEDFYGIKPDTRQDVNYHIKVPKDAPNGGQYAVLFAIVSRDMIDKGSNIRFDSQLGMKIYAKVSGETRIDGKVKSVDQAMLYRKLPISSVAQVENTGNVDFSSEHEYSIRSLFNEREIFESKTTHRIMPDTTREINIVWEEKEQEIPSFGIFKVRHKITFFNKTQYDQEKIVILAPLWLVLILVAIGLLLVVFLFFFIRTIVRKIQIHKKFRMRKNNLS
jgi:hypothetical protein